MIVYTYSAHSNDSGDDVAISEVKSSKCPPQSKYWEAGWLVLYFDTIDFDHVSAT